MLSGMTDSAAVSLGRRGGYARARLLTAVQLRVIGLGGAAARWAGHAKKTKPRKKASKSSTK